MFILESLHILSFRVSLSLFLLFEPLIKWLWLNLIEHIDGFIMIVLVLAVLVNPDFPEPLVSENQWAHFAHFTLGWISIWSLPLPHVNVAIKWAWGNYIQLLSICDPVNGISVCTPFVSQLNIVCLEFNFCLLEDRTSLWNVSKINSCNESWRIIWSRLQNWCLLLTLHKATKFI